MTEEMLDHAHENFKILSAEYKQHYIHHPPSHAVDGKDDTCFQSPASMFVLLPDWNRSITFCPDASEGDWVSLDLVIKPAWSATINMIVDEETQAILSLAVVEVDINGWVRC